MCQPFGTNVTAVCRLPHAKAITGQIMLYLENFNKVQTVCKIGAPALVGSVTGTPQVPLFLAPGWPRSPASTSSSGSLGPAALLYETGPNMSRR